MLVRAKKRCYFGSLKEPGDVFTIPDDAKPNLATLEIVEQKAPQETVNEPEAEIILDDDLSDDEIREKLRAAGVEFHPRMGRAKLLGLLAGLESE